MTFERVYTHAIDKAPQLAPKSTYVIHEWLAKGYDPIKDIIPAIDQATKHGSRSIQSFAYFSGFIRSTNERRIKEVVKPIELTPEQRNKSKANTLIIKQRAGMYVNDSELAWLENYKRREIA